jgi:acetyl-CoA carboxylase biotin carboxylase subunit/3-methylcrotonyl-CoA carboxylase alpha subunit
VETGVAEGLAVTPYYDPLLAKIVAHGEDRAAAIARLDQALADTVLDLVAPSGNPAATNLAFLRKALASPAFVEGRYDTTSAEALAKG